MFFKQYQKVLLTRVTTKNSSNLNSPCDRLFHTTNFHSTKYYDALGITPSATQNDIKTAYYKLSMLYHPDKNKGSEVAAQKFRDITEAYEVLGTLRTRKLYDKGIIHPSGAEYSKSQQSKEDPEAEDDPQTKFYKAHMRKSKVPHASGRTTIYDFDEWSRAHYGKSFARRQDAKTRFDNQEKHKIKKELALRGEILIFLMGVSVVGFGTMLWQEHLHDVNKLNKKNES